MNRIESLCRDRNVRIGELLEDAGVSRNAFYSLARKRSVVPGSLIRIADHLGVPVSSLLDESLTPIARMEKLIAETERIRTKCSDCDSDNIRHTLLLLDEKPVDRLRRALRRGRYFNFR
jgi:transcriptional regulator with XRE-family HTH domain